MLLSLKWWYLEFGWIRIARRFGRGFLQRSGGETGAASSGIARRSRVRDVMARLSAHHDIKCSGPPSYPCPSGHAWRPDRSPDWLERASGCEAFGARMLVGPPGLEPGTKGFAWSGSFPTGADYLFTRSFRCWGAGRSSL